MSSLDPKHELPAGHDPLELPPGYRGPDWAWLLAMVIATATSFMLIEIFLIMGMDISVIAVIVPLLFVFTIFLVHTVADQAR